MTQDLTRISHSACFGGTVETYSHLSDACQCSMRFSIYLPPQSGQTAVPVVYFLSGLTCTEENFTVKAGAQRYAAEYGLAIVAPDTSPRGENVPDDETSWDFGKGAGFYVNATQAPWNQHYQMYRYVVEELPAVIATNFPVRGDRTGIMGHSMGGHGALVAGLRNPTQYQSISAFSPICAPMQCPWGQKAFSHYLGNDASAWAQYDASELVKTHADPQRPILVDQGASDSFLIQGQLLPDVFQTACEDAGQPLILRMHDGYDHSYFFIASFMGDHLRHHAKALYAA